MANAITYSRMAFLVPIVVAVYLGAHVTALILFVVAALTDWLDGFVARKLGQVSETGKVMDQIADKVLVTGLMIFMVEWGTLPAWLVVTIVWRDLMVSAVRMLAAKGGRIIAANAWGKAKTVSQMALVISILSEPVLPVHALTTFLLWLTFFLTLLSGFVYIWRNSVVFRT